MNIFKESRAYLILGCLYFYKQMGYAQFKHIFDEKTYECTKDAMQKLVRAGYVEKIQKHGITSFALTQNGYKICLRYFETIDFQKPVRDASVLDRINRVNYESLVFRILKNRLISENQKNEKIKNENQENENQKNKIQLNEYFDMYFAPLEKDKLTFGEPLAVQQFQGSTLSFVLIMKDKNEKWKMICFFFLYGQSKVFNETTEKNMMHHIRKKYENYLKENGFEVPIIESKAVFITDSYGLIAEIVKKSLETKRQRDIQHNNGHIRTRGAIVESTFGFRSSDLHFLVNDGNIIRLINRIVHLLNIDSSLWIQFDQKYCGCCILPKRSFMEYAKAYQMLVDRNDRGSSFMDKRIYIENDQIPYVKYIRDRYMTQERVEELNNHPLYDLNDNPIFLS